MKKYRVDTVFYYIGKIIWLPVILVGSWFAKSGYSRIGELFACSFYRVCGFPCPGCGGTRAVFYLFEGEIGKSFVHHPAVLYMVAAYVHFMILYCYRKHKYGQHEAKEIHVEYYMYGLIAVILLQWAVKLVNHFMV